MDRFSLKIKLKKLEGNEMTYRLNLLTHPIKNVIVEVINSEVLVQYNL